MVDCKENDNFDLGVKGLIGINNRDVAYKLMECNLNFTLQALSLYHPCLWQDKKNLSISLSISKLTISLILFTNMTISTLLILAVCRTCVYYFLTGLNHHSLCGSVVEHQNVESEGLRFNSSWGFRFLLWQDEKTSFSISYQAQNLPSQLFYLQALSCESIKKTNLSE